MKFKSVKNGYDPTEVDEYLKRIREVYDETLIAQRDRIFALKDELTKAESALREYDSRKARIGNAIESALQKADDIDRLTRRKIAGELANLRKFHKKWLEYFAKIVRKYPLDGELSFAEEADKTIADLLKEADATPSLDFKSDTFDPIGKIEDHLAMESVEDSNFDYDAALHPTDDLEHILSDLGIFFDDKK